MAEPKEGYNSGFDRVVIVAVDSDGITVPSQEPKEGWSPPQRVVHGTVDSSGDFQA